MIRYSTFSDSQVRLPRGGLFRRLGNSNSHGFTLVELLVVITIIGILIALLLPAVQAAREAARKLQCTNNLKQIGLSLHNYAQAMGMFPPAAIAAPYTNAWNWDIRSEAETTGTTGKHGTSWMLQILPFMEQQSLFEQWNFQTNVQGNRVIAEKNLAAFYCPSRRSDVRSEDLPLLFSGWTGGGTDYGGCIGRANSFGDDCSHGLVPANYTNQARLGIFVPNQGTRFGQIRDGTSNTIISGELQRIYVPNGSNCEEVSKDGWAVGGISTLFDTCDSIAQGGYGPNPTRYGGLNNLFFESAGSEHPGGANFGLADGSVCFISENINQFVYSYLGSMDDGQTVTPYGQPIAIP